MFQMVAKCRSFEPCEIQAQVHRQLPAPVGVAHGNQAAEMHRVGLHTSDKPPENPAGFPVTLNSATRGTPKQTRSCSPLLGCSAKLVSGWPPGLKSTYNGVNPVICGI